MNTQFPSTWEDTRPTAAIFRLSEEDIREFQELIRNTCGVWMTAEEATTRANALLLLTSVILDLDEQDAAFGRVRTSSHLSDSSEHSTLQT